MNKYADEKHIALFVASLAGGGAERVMLNLAEFFLKNNYKVDLILAKYEGPLIKNVPKDVRIIKLQKRSWLYTGFYMLRLPMENWKSVVKIVFTDSPSVFRRLEAFVDYLKYNQPTVVLSTLNAVNIASLMGKYIAKSESRFYVRQAIFFSQHTNESKDYFDINVMPLLLKKWYPIADSVISVSNEMKNDLIENAGLSKEYVETIYNPLNIDHINKAIKESDDDFLEEMAIPIVISAGRLVGQKDYPTLLFAISKVVEKRHVKLIILGDGPEYSNIVKLISKLSLQNHVILLGNVSNPYKYISRSNVFVLSSTFEGMPNVLLEALACQCTIVSTDCPSGPREILNDGQFGSLIPVGDVEALEQAILNAMDCPVDKKLLYDRANDFALDTIGEKYIKLMFNLTHR